MSVKSKADRARGRAAALYKEASNCLDLAVPAGSVQFAAELIDEAARLMRRSAELSEEATPS